MAFRIATLCCFLTITACASTAPTDKPETQIKYFKVSADPENPDVPPTLLSSGQVVLFVDDNQCLKVRSIISEEMRPYVDQAEIERGYIPIFFPDVIVGSDDEGFYIRHPAAIEKYRNQDDIIGADPVRLGDVTSFGMSHPPGVPIGYNGADKDVCVGSFQGIYMKPPFRRTGTLFEAISIPPGD